MYMLMNQEKYYEKLKKISENIKKIIYDFDQKKQMRMSQNQMMQQQMMQQQLMQQQQMKQQMRQQQMMQQQMMQQQMMRQQQMMQMMEQMNSKKFIFKNSNGRETSLSVQIGTTVEELFNKYINEVYGITSKNITFLYNAQIIKRNDQRAIEDAFDNTSSITITVIEI